LIGTSHSKGWQAGDGEGTGPAGGFGDEGRSKVTDFLGGVLLGSPQGEVLSTRMERGSNPERGMPDGAEVGTSCVEVGDRLSDGMSVGSSSGNVAVEGADE
jgi:hypothetical protein